MSKQHFLKYECTPTQWATAKAKIETTDAEGNTNWDASKVIAVVELGNLCTQWGTDEEGNKVCEAYNPKYAVDILWNTEDTSLASNIVWPLPCGVHIIAGWEEIGRAHV